MTPYAITTSAGTASEYAGSSSVDGFGNYTFNFTLTNIVKDSATHSDFLKIIFPNDLFNKEGDVRVPECALGTLFVMGPANTIYLEPSSDLSGFVTLNLDKMENP